MGAKYSKTQRSASEKRKWSVFRKRKDTNSAAKDFAALFHQQGLDHLTQEIMLMLVSPEEEDCSLSKAKLVSCMWRKAVDNLVLKTDKGKDMYLLRIKSVMRRAVSRYEEGAALTLEGCCVEHVAQTLRLMTDPKQGLEDIGMTTILIWLLHTVQLSLDGKKAPIGYEDCEVYYMLTVLKGENVKKAALAWKKKVLSASDCKVTDDWTRAARAVLVYRLFWMKPEEAPESAE